MWNDLSIHENETPRMLIQKLAKFRQTPHAAHELNILHCNNANTHTHTKGPEVPIKNTYLFSLLVTNEIN